MGKLWKVSKGEGGMRMKEGRRAEVHNQKQEPHTMMWGKNDVLIVDHHFRIYFSHEIVTFWGIRISEPSNLKQGAGVFASSCFESG